MCWLSFCHSSQLELNILSFATISPPWGRRGLAKAPWWDRITNWMIPWSSFLPTHCLHAPRGGYMEWSAGARIWGQIMVMHLEIETRGAGSGCFSDTSDSLCPEWSCPALGMAGSLLTEGSAAKCTSQLITHMKGLLPYPMIFENITLLYLFRSTHPWLQLPLLYLSKVCLLIRAGTLHVFVVLYEDWCQTYSRNSVYSCCTWGLLSNI